MLGDIIFLVFLERKECNWVVNNMEGNVMKLLRRMYVYFYIIVDMFFYIYKIF